MGVRSSRVLFFGLLIGFACAPSGDGAFIGTWRNDPSLASPPYKDGEYRLQDRLVVSADHTFRWEPTGLVGRWQVSGSEMQCRLDAPFPPLTMLSGDETKFSLSLKDDRLVWKAVGARVDPKPVYVYVRQR